MHIVHGTNQRVQHLQRMPQWGRIANGLYYKQMCIKIHVSIQG